jgi:TolB-like protein
VIIFGIGFFPAVIAAWLFEFTPDGLKFDKDADRSATGSPAMHHKLDRIIIVGLLLGISFFAFDKFVLAPERAAVREAEVAEQVRTEKVVGFYGDRSIAVVPFENMSSDPEQQYFADGIAEEVLNLLARIRTLRVISRSSAFALRDENLDVPEIGARLNVAHVLEGSVRRAGNRVRITAQLIEARSDTHLWSHTYERELDDVFQIQDEIAADVVANLQIELLNPLPRSQYVDPEVISLTAQANQLTQSRPEGVGEKIYLLMSLALDIDPDYVPALDLMADALWFRVDGDIHTWEDMQRDVALIYDRIRELDPNSGYPDYYEAFKFAAENRLEESAALYGRALEKDKGVADNVRFAGYFARHIGKLDASVGLLTYSLAIDPLCHQCRRRYAESLMFAGDYVNAQWEFERYLAVANEGWDGYVLLLLLQGKTGEALAYLDSVDVDDEWNYHAHQAGKTMTLFSLGRVDEADTLFAELGRSDYPDQRALTFFLTVAAAWMGKNDLAFEGLFEMGATEFQYLRRRTFSPLWRGLHDDPRWNQWRELVGMSAERLDAIEFNPDLPE